jgi:hypothetical protein
MLAVKDFVMWVSLYMDLFLFLLEQDGGW